MAQTPKEFHYDYFEIRDGQLYYEDMNMPLTNKDGKLRSASEIVNILKKNRLRKLSFDIPGHKLTA